MTDVAASTATASGAQPPGPTALRLLLVDDDSDFREWFMRQLLPKGFHVTPVGTADEAIARLKAGQTFDVLFMDHRLGSTRDGLAALQRMREFGIKIPTVVVSGLMETDAAEQYWAAGVHASWTRTSWNCPRLPRPLTGRRGPSACKGC